MILKTSIFLIILCLLISCKADNLDKVLESSQTPRLDMAYYTIIKAEMQEHGKYIAIVDRTIDTTSTKINGITPRYSEKDKVIYWKKEIFPSAKYINGVSLKLYINENPESYWKLRDKYQSGWLELTAPYFTKNEQEVLIEVRYFQGTSTGAISYYLLEWTGSDYRIKEKRLISIS